MAVLSFRSVVGIEYLSVVVDAVAIESAGFVECGVLGNLVDGAVVVHVVGDQAFGASGIAASCEREASAGTVADGAGKVVAERFPVVVSSNDEASQS